MLSCNVDALEQVVSKTDGEAKRVAEIIIELRTLEKWISTYVEGMLNRVVDGKIYPSIDNAGTVTGRVSSDLQQQPKEALLDKDGNELFHPRKAFINKPNQKMYFFDYSQMEMRLQAHYTLILGNGDVNLCRAFMPYKCTSFIDGREFVFKQDDIESNEWVDDNGNLWSPVDLHTMTTLKAFPHLTINDPNFKHYRRLGKMCNFLKNYGGAYKALKNKLKVDDDIIEALNKGYYEAYPQVLNYQKWVTKQLLTYGYIENLFGRKYFVSSSSNYYKAYNYAVQGSCADFFKKKQIILYDLLKDKKSKSLMVIHDEIVVSIDESEEYLVKKIKDIMDDYTLEIPMISGVDCTQTNWAEKVEIE
jgi:DNA polymerase-1